MFADFPEGDLYVVFEEGDLDSLESSGFRSGEVRGSYSSGFDGGSILLRYDEEFGCTKPGIAVYDSDDVGSVHGSDYDIEVVVGESIFDPVDGGDVYNSGVDEFQEISGDAEVIFFPGEEDYDPDSFEGSNTVSNQ